ncbi:MULTISPECIES: lipid II flippase Amj family protein [Bacillaceae]|uniref:lipid II flippase Amj family protein n=1 Tax=Bacillaceae TaxID=186817 RepID=UPI001E50E6DB|nr:MULTISPECIES: lipid II flippase Amj family protein [Bacillaceae]MCE4048857.1 lipid II flippase Amj family protein [Bacillus sp. Au-Bac7]MCM3033081.1 lipid II flippase Amj family protein [Niallia sp. MER 6]UPO90636.1 lipid II flippase Amj family protein [Niallia sp. Man26]
MDLVTGKVLLISLFLLLVTMIETLAYSTRISGARVKLIATALSLFSTLLIVSRFSTMFQQPLTAKLIAEAPSINPMHYIEEQYRVLIGVTSFGVLLGIFLFPTFINIFSRAIIQLSQQSGSVVALFIKNFNKNGFKKVVMCFRLPRFTYLKGITLKTIPKRLFIINVVISAVFTIGVLSSIYASMLVPETYAPAALMSSGIINGIATILLTLFIDPKASVLADKVMKKQVDYIYLKSYSLTMIGSKFVGTIVAQLIFIPAAYYVAWFVKLI